MDYPVVNRLNGLPSTLNFRDLGGYRSADGRTVKWRTLYRTGTTHALTESDLAELKRDGIRFAYDFRSTAERAEFPSRLKDIDGMRYGFHDHQHLSGDIKRMLQAPESRAEHARALMIDMYRQIPYQMKEGYTALFSHIVNGDLPLVFGCTAGKDRAGIGAALVLSALGIPRQQIFEDYLLSQQFSEQTYQLVVATSKGTTFGKAAREVWQPLLDAEVAYLHAMFERLEHAEGSVEGYFKWQLGLDPISLERVRNNLLE